MPRYGKEHKQTTRRRIIEAAGRRLKRDGIDGSGVATLMADAGLTNGAFYAHFDSKEDLVASTVADQLHEQRERYGTQSLEEFVRGYLSPQHRDDTEGGCPSAALLAEIAADAGLSRGTPGYFFGSKEELYRAVLGRAFSDTVDLIRSAGFGSGGFAEVTAAAIGRYLDFLASRPTFVQLVVRECLDGGRFLEGLPEHIASIAEGMRAFDADRGEIRSEIEPRNLLLSAISLCWFPIVARPLTTDLGFDPDSEAFTEKRKEPVIELFLHGSVIP